MQSFWTILRHNPNYRYLWFGQSVSEIGDHFNTIAVLSLALKITGSGFSVGIVMIARILPMIMAAPVAGIVLDRMDRRKVMLASDVLRALVAAAHLMLLRYPEPWLMYALSALLMFASPFFTSGRSAILPSITSHEELHTANAMTQTTSWLTLSIGTMMGGISTAAFGYDWAFTVNAVSFVLSGLAISLMKSPGGFKARRAVFHVGQRLEYLADISDNWKYMRSRPLIFAIGLVGVGWALGGGAAQVLFTLYGEVVYNRGPAGIGLIWSFAGIGLVLGGVFAHRVGPLLTFPQYKRVLSWSFAIHGLSYVLFAVMPTIWYALIFITISRISMGFNNVLNRTMLLRHVPDELRGRVLTTVDAMSQAMMMISLGVAGAASDHFPIRAIGVAAGFLSSLTAVFWTWANLKGRLPYPGDELAE